MVEPGPIKGVTSPLRSVGQKRTVPASGPDDGAVSVERAKLDGAADFIVIDATHTFIMQNDTAIRQTLHFLRNGRFDHAPQPDATAR